LILRPPNVHESEFLLFFLAVLSLISCATFFAALLTNKWHKKPGVRNAYALTMFTFVTGLGALSIFSHQGWEFDIFEHYTLKIEIIEVHRPYYRV
jgi:hypothetical protein